jgi:hypothetical protein
MSYRAISEAATYELAGSLARARSCALRSYGCARPTYPGLCADGQRCAGPFDFTPAGSGIISKSEGEQGLFSGEDKDRNR